MPRNIRSRASPLNLTSLAAMVAPPWLSGVLVGGVIDHAHDVGFLHDHEVLAIELDLGARPLAEQHAVAAFDVERMQRALVVARAGPNRDDLAFHRLFLSRVGDENTAGGLRLRLDTTDQDAVLQWTQFHKGLLGPNLSERSGTVRSRVPTHAAMTWGPGHQMQRPTVF